MIDRMSALWIKNTSDNDPCSYEATKAVTKKALKKSEALTGAFYPLSAVHNHIIYIIYTSRYM